VVYLVATAGFPNYGDELITASWLRQLAVRVPNAAVWVDCPQPGTAAVLLDGLHPGARFVDTLWRLCWTAPSDEPWELAAWVQRAVADPGLAPRWAAGIELLRDTDVVHIVGGGYIHATWPRHIGLIAAVAGMARRYGVRAALTGQGLVPASADSAALLAVLGERFEVLDVRDEPSAELLRGAGMDRVRVSSDDAFLAALDPSAPPALSALPGPANHGSGQAAAPPAAAPEFMLCAQSDMLGIERGQLASVLMRTLRAWRVSPDNLGVVEGIPGVDREIYALLEHEFPAARFYPFAEVWRTGLPVAPGQTWLSTRFHPHLMAASAGASGVAIPVSPDYYHTKHSSLITLGSRWTLAGDPTGTAVPELPTAGGFPTETVRAMYQQKAWLADQIYGLPPAGASD
jgi:hypothetical protein